MEGRRGRAKERKRRDVQEAGVNAVGEMIESCLGDDVLGSDVGGRVGSDGLDERGGGVSERKKTRRVSSDARQFGSLDVLQKHSHPTTRGTCLRCKRGSQRDCLREGRRKRRTERDQPSRSPTSPMLRERRRSTRKPKN